MTSTVYIAKNVYGGDGLGRLGDGRVIFVPGAWAGEQVKAEITHEHKRFVNARLVEVVEASAERIDGGELKSIPGAVYANLGKEAELSAKAAQLAEFFERARIRVNDLRLVADGGFRNKVTYHFAKQRGEWVIGYRLEPSHELIDIKHDPLAADAINAKLPEIRKNIITLLTTGPIAVRRETERKERVTIRWTNKSGVKWWLGDAPDSIILKETTLGNDFEVPADGFYQVNPIVGEELVKSVVEAYRQGEDAASNLLDLYCGVGVFGLCCKPARLIGIESGRRAIDFAKRNAEAQRYANARFYAEQVGRNLRRIPIGRNTTVIIDPPRGGLESGVAKWLANSNAPRIFYVSCDPATLMRDLREITTAYDVEAVKWFNMFPRTARFETFVQLRHK